MLVRRSLIAFALAATTICHAGFVVTGYSPALWGAANSSLGFATPQLVETFENTQLVPGLSATWIAQAGTVGPSATLPNLFRTMFDDPPGAFSSGNFDGIAGLVSGQANKSWSYSDSSHWGQLQFDYAPGATAVGFSLQQMDVDARLYVNGVALGFISALAGGGTGPNGGRNGYYKIAGTGGDKVFSVRLENFSGDGFVLDHLILENAPEKYRPACFGPSAWFSTNADLGLLGAQFEDFETKTMVSGVQVKFQTVNGTYGPSSTLPNTFNPANDPFGNAFVTGTWGGTRTLVNTQDNLSHAYNEKDSYGDIEITLPIAAQSVGFAMCDMEQPVSIFVNNEKIGSTNNLRSTNQLVFSTTRNGFIRIDAVGGTPIQTIRLTNQRAPTFSDGWSIDHLAWLPAGARLGGFVQYQDFGALATDHPLTVEVYNHANGSLVTTLNVKPDALGNWGVPNTLSPGTYDFAFKADHWLRKRVNNVTVGTGSVRVDASMLNGDCDGDNSVTVFDYSILSDSFDKSSGEAGFDPAGDLDGDGTVTVFDYSILSNNFDRSGD